MSTLVDSQINAWGLGGGLEPFDPALVNPASVNLRIGTVCKIEGPSGDLYEVDISENHIGRPYLVDPGEWILTHTMETVSLADDLEAEVCLRSSAARAGWDHCLAGYVDPGWSGSLTLEFQNVRRYAALPIYPGLQLCQLRLRRLDKRPINHYGLTGRYHGDRCVNHCQDPTLGV